MNLKQKSIRGLGWSALQGWGGHGITLVVFTILARLLDPAAFGLVALGNVFVAFVKVFVDQGFTAALIQRRDLEDQHLNTAFWTNIVVGISLTGFGIALADTIAGLFQEPALAPIIKWMSAVFLISSFSGVQQALLRRNLEFRKLALRNLVSNIAGGVVGVAMAVLGYGVWSLVGQQLTSSIVKLIILWTLSHWRPGFTVSRRHFDDLISFGANVVGIKLMEFFNRNSDNFLIGYYLGTETLGFYAIAYKLIQTVTRLFTAVTGQVSFSSFSALQSHIDRMRRAFYTAVQLTSLLTFPVFAGIAILAPYFIPPVFGAQWATSIPVTQVLAFAAILETIYVYNANVIMAMGKPFWRLNVNMLNAVANIIGFMIAVRWGIVAVATAYTIRAYLLSPLPLILVKKLIHIDLKLYLSNLGVQFVSTILMSISVYFIMSKLSTTMAFNLAALLTIVCGGVVYLTAIFVIKPQLITETVATVRSAVRSRGNS